MVTLTFTSPSTWRVFRQPLDSSTTSPPTPPSPPKPKETPLVSQLVCVSQDSDTVGQVRIVPEEDPKAEIPKDHCDIPSFSPSIPLRSHSFNLNSRPRSFIASTRTKTFKRQSKPISMPRPPTSEGAVPSSRHFADTLRLITSKKRFPKWWPRGDSSIAIPIANDTSSSPILPSRRGTSDEVLVLGNVDTAAPISPTLFPEVASNIPKTTVERMEEVPQDTGNLLQMAVRQVELQREAARRASADRLKLYSKMAATGVTPALKHNITCSRQASLDDHTPPHTTGQIDTTKSSQKHLPVARGNVSFEILRTDAKAQQMMRSRLSKEENPVVVAPFSSKRRLSPSPPRSVTRKAVPPVRKKEEAESHLLQEVTVDVKHKSNRSKIDQEAIAAFLNITTGSDVPDFLKVKVVDLAKEVQDWQKMGMSARVKPLMQQQSKVSSKVSIDMVDLRCSSPPSPRGIRGPTSAQMSQESTQQQTRDLKSSLPTHSLHTSTVGNSRLPSRSTTPPSRYVRTSQTPLPPLPTEAASRVHMLKLQRSVNDAMTQTSELEYITLIKERDKGILTPMASKHPQVHIATTSSPSQRTQEVNSITCISDALEELTSAPRSPPFDPEGENSPFLSREESSLDFGSLGPPTTSSQESAREGKGRGAQSPVDQEIIGSATNNNGPSLVPFGLGLAIWNQGQGHHHTNPVIPHRTTQPVASPDQRTEDAELDKQFLTLLAETQVDTFPTVVHDATEVRNAEDSRSAASTPSFECVRVWRDNVAGEADRSVADPLGHQVGAKDVYLIPRPDVNSGEGTASSVLPKALRVVTHPNSLTTRVAHSVFYPSAATATRDSQSELSELESPVPTIRSSEKPGDVNLNATDLARDASNGKEVDQSRKKAEKRKIHVPNQHLKSTASSVLSWGTRSRRTLSESEAMRLFGPLGKRVEETSKKEGASHNERVQEIVEDGERGRKKTRSRNTFGLESVHSPGPVQEVSDVQQQDEGQIDGNKGVDIVRSKSKGVDPQWVGDGAFMLATTTTTTTTTATHSLLSVLRSPSPGAKGVGTVSRDDAPLINFDDDHDNDGVDKLVNRINSAGTTEGNLPVIVRTMSHPPSTSASPSTPKAQDRLTMDARALHLIAHRIGKATQEMDSVKRDLMSIARAQRFGGTQEGGKPCILGAETERGEGG